MRKVKVRLHSTVEPLYSREELIEMLKDETLSDESRVLALERLIHYDVLRLLRRPNVTVTMSDVRDSLQNTLELQGALNEKHT